MSSSARPLWIPVDEVAAALGVDAAEVEQRMYLVNPRTAQLADGRRRIEIDSCRVWQLADRLGVSLPARFPRPAAGAPQPQPSRITANDLDERGQANVRAALRP